MEEEDTEEEISDDEDDEDDEDGDDNEWSYKLLGTPDHLFVPDFHL